MPNLSVISMQVMTILLKHVKPFEFKTSLSRCYGNGVLLPSFSTHSTSATSTHVAIYLESKYDNQYKLCLHVVNVRLENKLLGHLSTKYNKVQTIVLCIIQLCIGEILHVYHNTVSYTHAQTISAGTISDTITECIPQQHQSRNPSLKTYNLRPLLVYCHL